MDGKINKNCNFENTISFLNYKQKNNKKGIYMPMYIPLSSISGIKTIKSFRQQLQLYA